VPGRIVQLESGHLLNTACVHCSAKGRFAVCHRKLAEHCLVIYQTFETVCDAQTSFDGFMRIHCTNRRSTIFYIVDRDTGRIIRG